MVVLDHLQGFAEGDLNASDTATALATATSQIVASGDIAVILTAHVNKGQIKAETIEAGFTTGSLAFENAARQVTGVIKLPEIEAEEMGIDRDNFIKLVMHKNSYGPAGQVAYLKKEFVPAFHTIRFVPHVDAARAIRSFTSRDERLKSDVLTYVAGHVGTTKNKLDDLSGKSGQFKASKAEMRRIVEEMLDEGTLVQRGIDPDEKKKRGLPQQTKKILSVPD